MTAGPVAIARLERFGEVASTQRVVRGWLDAGTREIAVAVADVQTQGRGRHGRDWTAPPGAALLVSCGFRPRALDAPASWRLGATVALAMLDAAEEAAGLRDATLWLKWPNDIVVDASDGRLRKVAGVLGEVAIAADAVESAVVGVGVNADWAAGDFPADLASSMSSLREVAGGRPIDREALLEAFLDRLEVRYDALIGGFFDSAGWAARQRTTGHDVEVLVGASVISGRALGVAPTSGSLIVATSDGVTAEIDSGEVTRCRIVEGLRRV